MSLSHYDPLASLRAVENAFTRLLTEPQSNRPWSPSVDIYETENELVLKADLPDVEPKDIDVRVENQTLTIAGERKFEARATIRAITGSNAAMATSSAASPCRTPSIPKDQCGLQERRAHCDPAQEGSRQTASDQSRSHRVTHRTFKVASI